MTTNNYNYRDDYYFEQMKEDIETYLEDNFGEYDLTLDQEDLYEKLYEDLWVEDDVTGNGTKDFGYTGGSQELAQSHVGEGLHHLREAIQDFDCEKQALDWLLEGDWICLDATIRCYLLGQVLTEVLKEKGLYE